MSRALRATFVIGLLLLGACSSQKHDAAPAGPQPDYAMLTNAGDQVLERVIVTTSQGKELWTGSLGVAEQKTFSFLPDADGHFVVVYAPQGGRDQKKRKGYFTTQGGHLHSFVFGPGGGLEITTSLTSPVSLQ